MTERKEKFTPLKFFVAFAFRLEGMNGIRIGRAFITLGQNLKVYDETTFRQIEKIIEQDLQSKEKIAKDSITIFNIQEMGK